MMHRSHHAARTILVNGKSCFASSSLSSSSLINKNPWSSSLSSFGGRSGSKMQCFSSTSSVVAADGDLGDQCNLNIVSSHFPPINPGPYPPVAEFIMSNWKVHGGFIKNDKVAILDGSTGLQRTFGEYYHVTSNLAATLHHDMGIDEHSTVAMFSPNHVDYLPVALAVSLCGAKLTPINPLYTPSELETILERSRTSVLIAHVSKLDVALETAKRCHQHVKHVIVMTDFDEAVPTGTVGLHQLITPLDGEIKHAKSFHTTIRHSHRDAESHPYLLPYSSGTTGMPKGVCLSHSNIVANLLQFDEVEHFGFPSDHKLFTPLPFFHIYAFTASMLYCAWKGNQVITFSGRFDLESFCRLVQEHRPQRAHLVPPILVNLAKHPVVDQYDLSSLQFIMSAAAPLGLSTEDAVKARIGSDIKQAWGMSELSPLGTINSDYTCKPGSVGPLAPSTFGKIVDEHGVSLGPNLSGELVIKGPQVMMGYLDDPDKTAECLSKGGWLRTGDIAHYDEDGFFFITDRVKELIKVRGFQVAPAELESLLLTHEHVSDAAVIPVPCDEAGELPRAYVVLKDTDEAKQLGTMDLYQWIQDRVAPHKRLKGGVVFTDAIPKSASGKILRRVLRDQYQQEERKEQAATATAAATTSAAGKVAESSS